MKVPSCSVICCGSTLCVPMVVTEMSSVLRANANIEGLFRKAGSQNRQKDIKVCYCISSLDRPNSHLGWSTIINYWYLHTVNYIDR